MTAQQLTAAEAHLAAQASRVTLHALVQAPGLSRFTIHTIRRAPAFPAAIERSDSGLELFRRRVLMAWLRRVGPRINVEDGSFD